MAETGQGKFRILTPIIPSIVTALLLIILGYARPEILIIGGAFTLFAIIAPPGKLRSIFLVFALAGISIAIMARAGFLEDTAPTFGDGAYHKYHSWVVDEILLGQFSGLEGWNAHFQLGHVEFFDMPPLIFLLVALLKRLSFGALTLDFAYRLVCIFSFTLAAISVFLLSRSLGLAKGGAFLASLFFLISRHHLAENGVFSTYLSLALALSAASLAINQRPTLAGLLAALSISAHPSVFIFSAVFCALACYGKANFSISDWAKSAFVFFAVSLPYLVQIVIGREYSANTWANLPDFWPSLFSTASVTDELFRNPLFLSAFVYAVLSLILKGRRDENAGVFSGSAAVFSLALVLAVAKETGRPIFSALVPERGAFVLIAALSIAGAIACERVFDPKFQYGALKKFSILLPFACSAVFFLFYIVSSWNCPSCSEAFRAVNGNSFENWYGGLSPRMGIFSSDPDIAFFTMADYLRERGPRDSRTLFEDSSENIYGGWLLPLLPEKTGAFFIGGPVSSMNLESGAPINFFDGVFVGKELSAYSEDELAGKFRELNIGDVAVWSEESKEALSRMPRLFSKKFETPKNRLNISIVAYEFILAEENYVLSGGKSLLFSNGRIEIESQGGTVLLSSRYHANWKARTVLGNGTEYAIETRRNGILLEIPDAPAGKVVLEYVPSLASRLALFVAGAGIIFAFLSQLGPFFSHRGRT